MPTKVGVQGSIVRGGRSLYGIPVGILMLDTQFPRIPGDVGNATTWPFPVLYRIVDGASPHSVVRELTAEAWLEPFIEAALSLERAGVDLITTGCGFLVLFQQELQCQLRIPVLTSSLLQIPWISTLLPPDRSIGILTVESTSLTEAHLRSAGVPQDRQVTVQGLDEAGGYFTGQLLENRLELDVDRCRAEHRQAARQLMERDPNLGAIVLECTNMPPYADTIREVTGLPVYDMTTLVCWTVMGITQRSFTNGV